MIVGGYSLDLYCENDEISHYLLPSGIYLVGNTEVKHQYAGNTFIECARQARKDGWKINTKNHTCICPVCRNTIK